MPFRRRYKTTENRSDGYDHFDAALVADLYDLLQGWFENYENFITVICFITVCLPRKHLCRLDMGDKRPPAKK